MKKNSKLQTIALLILPFLIVGGLRVWVVARQTPHLEQIASEIGSIPNFRVGLHPNYSGSALLYFQETESGLGTFFCETATGKTHLLYEEKEKGYRGQFRILGWSPDDSVLAFAILPDGRDPANSGIITLCKGLTGEVITKIPAGGIAGDAQLVWMSSHAFAYSTFTHRSWLMYAEQPDGSWKQTKAVKRIGEGWLANLTRISPHSMAWQNKQTIWSYDFDSGATERVWEASTNQLINFRYPSESGNLLLNCKDHDGGFVAEFRPPLKGFDTNGSIVKVTRSIPASPYARVSMKDGRFIITIKRRSVDRLSGVEESTFDWDGMLFSVDGVIQFSALVGDHLYFVGSRKDGEDELWDYNAKSQSLRQVTSDSHVPFKWAKMSEPIASIYTNNQGGKASYHLWPPVNKVQGKKYPLVIASELHSWDAFQQAAPNAGWFYAHLDRTNANGNAWPEDVAELYRTLSRNADIDTNKVVFIASSAQNASVPQLLEDNLGVKFGLVLHRPAGLSSSLPDTHIKNILILGGTDDKYESAAAAMKLQDDGFDNGNCVSLLIQEGVQHLNRSVASERRDNIEFARFLSQNK